MICRSLTCRRVRRTRGGGAGGGDSAGRCPDGRRVWERTSTATDDRAPRRRQQPAAGARPGACLSPARPGH